MTSRETDFSPPKNPVASVRDAATHYRNFGEGMANETFWFNEASALDAVADEVEVLRAKIIQLEKYEQFAKRLQRNLDCPHTLMGERELRLLLEMLEAAK